MPPTSREGVISRVVEPVRGRNRPRRLIPSGMQRADGMARGRDAWNSRDQRA
jgi:hypothetical protein